MGRGGGNLGSSDGVVHADIGVGALGYSGVVEVGVRGEGDVEGSEAWACGNQVFLFFGDC
jgi:hypothetical protein